MEKISPHNRQWIIPTTVDTDFQPIYALSDVQYQGIINQLANLVIDTIQRLHQGDESGLAGQLTNRAGDILCNYDDDIVDYIQRAARRSEYQPRIIGNSREALLR